MTRQRQAPTESPEKPGLTEQQRRAVACRGASVVLSSGAGCGKTHVLTERYLSHLRDDGAEVGQVVAITFTDRAARQMRERIREAVGRNVKSAATDEEADRWALHLRNLETAQISTIHSFCSTLLRQYAIDAGLDPQFEVLEDVLAVNLAGEALSATLQRLLTEKSADLGELVILFGWPAVQSALPPLLRAWDEQGWREWQTGSAETVAARWEEYARTTLRPAYLQFLLGTRPGVVRCVRLLKTTPPLPGSQMADNAAALLDGLARLHEAEDLAAEVDRLRDLAKVGKERDKAWPAGVYDDAKDLLAGLRDELKAEKFAALDAASGPAVADVEVGQRFLRVVGEVVKAYAELKRQKGVLDFDDLLVGARNLLRDRADVRERVQKRIRHLLIDELQDTDPVQVELVEQLCGAGLTAGTLFTVGDHKQSIYRFRGADVHLFRHLRQAVPHEGRLGLTLNFRSQPAILDFANVLLGHRLEDYEPLVAHQPQVNSEPCVEFLWSQAEPKQNVRERRTEEAKWIARRIAALVGREELVVDRENKTGKLRPVRAGDVVLLFRAMSNVHLYETALRDQGLDYYLVGGRAFFAQQEVYDLLNLLRALENPLDAVNLAGTLRSPFCGLSDEALFVLSRHPAGLWAGLHDDETLERLPIDQRPAADRARRYLDRWHALKDRLPIAGLIGEIFADSGYDAATQFEFLGDRRLANLWKLLDLARTFDRSGLFGLPEFIRQLGDSVRTEPREEQAATQPENADVVRLMSIHQAKGLEFPVVFIPDFAASRRPGVAPCAVWDRRLGCVVRPPADDKEALPGRGWDLWQKAEAIADWHEELRTLYVACTRAQDFLVLSACVERPLAPGNAWTTVLTERFDPESGECLVKDLPPERTPRVRAVLDVDSLPAIKPKRTAAPRTTLPRLDGPGLPAPVAPLVAGLSHKRVFSVDEIERLLKVPADGPLFATDFAVQFDVEDGSDRDAWGGSADSDGLVNRLVAAGALEAASLGKEACASRDFLLAWKGADAATTYSVSLGVAGTVDVIWKDQAGAWRFALAAEMSGESPWETLKTRIALLAWAVERLVSAAPRDVTLVWGHNIETRPLSALHLAPHLKTIDAALSAAARRPLVDQVARAGPTPTSAAPARRSS